MAFNYLLVSILLLFNSTDIQAVYWQEFGRMMHITTQESQYDKTQYPYAIL